ncbi:hypothetical protein B296_00015018, partial [Ensete ventricosum]
SHVMASAAASRLDLDLSEKEVENPVVVTRAAWVENAQRPSLRREGETQHQSEDSKEEKRPAPRGHGCCTGRQVRVDGCLSLTGENEPWRRRFHHVACCMRQPPRKHRGGGQRGERKKGVRGAGILRGEKKEGGGVVELGIEEEGPR